MREIHLSWLFPQRTGICVFIGVKHSPPSFMRSKVVLNMTSAELELSMITLFTKLLATWALRTIASLCGCTTRFASSLVNYIVSCGWDEGSSYVRLMCSTTPSWDTSFRNFFLCRAKYCLAYHLVWWSRHEVMDQRQLWSWFGMKKILQIIFTT